MYRLRELEKKDIAIINQWRNKKELIDYLGAPFRYINLDVDEQWYLQYMNNRNNTVRCSIVDSEDTIIGLVSLTSINTINQSATFHIMIGESKNQNKGAGSFAVKSMIQHAFNNLNLRRIELSVLSNNTRAQHIYEKNGFIYEGTKRKSVFKNGDFVDMKIYSILKEDYLRGKQCLY